MRIVIGRGRNRHNFDVPSIKDKIARDQMSEEIKNFLFRPALLNKGN